ncbi:hypothetical protein EDF48_102514 [Curtobacterium sp. PhB191]|nr:hypothetical protein EDF48_102514 [Curtobacterium sp. PhB191]
MTVSPGAIVSFGLFGRLWLLARSDSPWRGGGLTSAMLDRSLALRSDVGEGPPGS